MTEAKHRPLPPADMIGVIARHLHKLGFIHVYRSRAGSRYLRLPPYPFEIRISDHKWSGFSKERQMQVIRSVHLQPVPMNETYLLAVEFAVRYVAACVGRTLQAKAR